jgi:NAD(P)-dependent dehydrogenase (short-subunit alcohol dehydrogenase family)
LDGALKDKFAIITGGGRGIGAATARLFVAEGANVVIASRTIYELEEVAETITAEFGPGRIVPIVADVSREEYVSNLFARSASKFGPVDILINNAAIVEKEEFINFDIDAWDKVMAVNIRGPFLCSREAFRQMAAAERGGTIINMSSLSGVRGPEKFPGMSSYIVSKHAITGLTESLAVEGKPLGIRVNCVAPGAVDTAMLKKAAPFLKTSTTPEDVARTLLFLADEKQSRHLNGALIEIFSNE